MKQKIAVLGRRGRLGMALCRRLAENYDLVAFGLPGFDLKESIGRQLSHVEFDLLINAAAVTNVDWCEGNPQIAERVNATAVGELAAVCSKRGVRCLHISTDYVFDGRSSLPYREDEPANPLSVYGKTKRLGEELLLQEGSGHLAIRVSWVFGPDKPSFIDVLLERAKREEQIEAISDKYSTPTYAVDFAEWIEPLLFRDPVGGVLHLSNSGSCSWREYGQSAIDAALEAGVKLKATCVQAISLDSMKSFIARRPVYTVMDHRKFRAITGISPRPWREAVRTYVETKYSAF